MDNRPSDASDVDLGRVEVATLIDALLQDKAVLCIADDRCVSVHLIKWMRAQQLLLAGQLEDAMIKPGSRFIASAEFTLDVSPR